MKIELSKREIEVILDLMGYGKTFSITHGDPEFKELKYSDKDETIRKKEKSVKIINIDDLEEKLRKKIGKVNK